MYELIQAAGDSYYIQCPAKVGVVTTGENEVCLIDGGGDQDAGKKILRLLNAQGWRLKAIYNTHSHADHIGGNQYLQMQTGCEVYAPPIEQAFTRYPILEPALLYGGFPPRTLRHKFLMAIPSIAQPLTREALPKGWTAFSLPGHAFDMVGFRTPDDVVYLADCLSSPETLRKYGICFLVDAKLYLETLEKVKGMTAACFVPAHASPGKDVSALAQLNIDAVNAVADRITALCREPTGFDALLKRLFEEYGLVMTFEQHARVGSTVRSYLTWLTNAGRLTSEIAENTLVWRAV